MSDVGLLDISVMPDGYYCFGASGGRDWYVDASRNFKDHSIVDTELELLDAVYDAIKKLLTKRPYLQYAYLGSGLQKHYGHITVAKQDAFGSVPEVNYHRNYNNTKTHVVAQNTQM